MCRMNCIAVVMLATTMSASAVDSWPKIEINTENFEADKATYLASIDDAILLFEVEKESGDELWRTDGTVDGTWQTVILSQAGIRASTRYFTSFKGNLYFSARSGSGGSVLSQYRLWITDGTPEGTKLAPELDQGVNQHVFGTVVYKDRLWFGADDGIHGAEGWLTDGTQQGTVLFMDFDPNGSGTFSPYGVVNDKLLFFSVSSDVGGELRITDGTAEGTALLKDINPATTSNGPLAYGFTLLGNKIVFSANDGTHGQELWATDGTTDGTTMLGDFNPEDGQPFSKDFNAEEFTLFKDILLFQASTSKTGIELWRTDGTAEGTYLVKDLDPTFPPSFFGGLGLPHEFTPAGDKVFFSARSSIPEYELWVTDGTEAGTRLVRNISPGDNALLPEHLTAVHGYVYLSGEDPVYARELFRSDGTDAGTTILVDFNSQGYGSPVIIGFAKGVLVMTAVPVNGIRRLYAVNIPPWAESLTAEGASPTSASSVEFVARFNEPVTGVDAGDFEVLTENVTGAGVTGAVEEDGGKAWRITVATGLGAGTIRLRLADNDTIVDTFAAGALPLEGFGVLDGSMDADRGFTTDPLPPTALLDGPSEFSDNPVALTLTFNRGVAGLSAAGFTVTNGTIAGITGGPDLYEVFVNPLASGTVTVQLITAAAQDYGAVPTAESNAWSGTYTGPSTMSADQNANHLIELTELLRVIQFYNVGAYHCDETGEDGYAAFPGVQDCAPHTTDYNPQDWLVSLTELLRLIQFYNTGGYHPCPEAATEDGFCPGPA